MNIIKVCTENVTWWQSYFVAVTDFHRYHKASWFSITKLLLILKIKKTEFCNKHKLGEVKLSLYLTLRAKVCLWAASRRTSMVKSPELTLHVYLNPWQQTIAQWIRLTTATTATPFPNFCTWNCYHSSLYSQATSPASVSNKFFFFIWNTKYPEMFAGALYQTGDCCALRSRWSQKFNCFITSSQKQGW